MKIITILSLTFLICSNAMAREVSLAEVLEWKYGPVASTEQVDPNDLTSQFPKMKITEWRSGTPQPDEEQIAKDMQEYQDYLVLTASLEGEKREAIVQKFNLTDDDIETLKRVMRE